jgi:2,3-bisphosphoglycerate-independent phosphoglycerate mutase
MSPLLLFFIDGLGIGKRESSNPFYNLDGAEPLAVFQDEEPQLPFDGKLVRTDACLDVAGRPQSASGQTTILTGVNVPATLGFHKQGFPNEAMRAIIREHSIFLQLKRAGIMPNFFANAYPNHFFENRPRWTSATTTAVEAAGMSFLTIEDLRNEQALYHDFTNKLLRETVEDEIELRTPEEAGAILARLASRHRFTLYEYFITDKIGHAQDKTAAQQVILELAAFVRSLLAHSDLARITVMLTSDHGNLEDLATRNHTLNLVPTIIWGAHRHSLATRIHDLADLTPAIIEALTRKEATVR